MAVPGSEGDILRAIARIEAKESDVLTRGDYDRIADAIAHPSARVRKAAAHALTLAGPAEAPAALLLERAAVEADPEVKARVLDSLIMLACMAQDRVEQDLADEDEEPDYNADAPDWYRRVRDLLLQTAGDTGAAEPVRAAAIAGLGDLSDDPAVKGTYIPYLDASEPALRTAALKAVSYSGDASGAEEALLAGLGDADPEVRKWSLLACGNTHLEAATEQIRPFLTAPEPEMQGAAWYAFAGCAPIEEARAFLERIGAEIDSEDPRWDDYDAAQYVLAEREGFAGWDESFDALAEEGSLPEGESEGEPEAPVNPIVPFRREAPKVGRNEPCPCGSGKKYKKCCGA